MSKANQSAPDDTITVDEKFLATLPAVTMPGGDKLSLETTVTLREVVQAAAGLMDGADGKAARSEYGRALGEVCARVFQSHAASEAMTPEIAWALSKLIYVDGRHWLDGPVPIGEAPPKVAGTFPELDAVAEHVADVACFTINRATAKVESEMPYRAQHTLEQTIKLLQERV